LGTRGVAVVVAWGLAGVVAAGCSSAPSTVTGTRRTAPTTTTTAGSAPSVPPPRTDAAGTVWLCRPGLADDPCAGDLDATAVAANGLTSSQPAQAAAAPAVDCFYVYPTVSTQTTDNANLEVQPAEVAAAQTQAALFSQDCRVWAPMYAQRTTASLAKGLGNDPTADAVAYASVLSGWKDYLAHFNDGRPVVFIGHSQGAAMLIRLLRSQIDPDPTLRHRLISAIILGGNVQVPTGQMVGGTFENIPGCGSPTQTGCVMAYSSFPTRPPKDSLFGRPGQGVSLQSGQTTTSGQQVLCTNPADLAGGTGALEPIFPTSTSPTPGVSVATPYVAFPDLYTAQCHSAGGATWLQVNDVGGPGDPRPRVGETLGPTWGLHLDDVNLALGNLVQIVSQEIAAYR
jgi:DUF3089 family protein